MINKYFKVTFLSDIVLNASSNTEGKIDALDYITGSSFLGMLAKDYTKYTNPFDIFHSGKVRFGEAKPLLNEKISYKIPLSFFKPKIAKNFDEVYNNHLVKYEKKEILDKQLKQQRNGFITSENKYFILDYNYEQKSAFDKINRKSKESSMFGYQAIKKGAIFAFKVSFDENINQEDMQRIIKTLLGEKNLGKSKQTQYGKVKIEEIKSYEENIENPLNDITYIYLNSSLALFDKNGFPTYELNKENLNLKDSFINWEKTQVRTKEITVYNSKRKSYDSSRLIIEKGSVIALENTSKDDIKTLKNGIGVYLSEGYGEILINPSFLMKDKFSLEKVSYSYKNIENSMNIELDKNLIVFLENKQKEKETIQSTSKRVKEFIKNNKVKFKNVNKAQWGQIRAILQVNEQNYKEEIKNFISHGVSEKQWKKSLNLIKETVQNESSEFLKLLCIQMPKQKENK